MHATSEYPPVPTEQLLRPRPTGYQRTLRQNDLLLGFLPRRYLTITIAVRRHLQGPEKLGVRSGTCIRCARLDCGRRWILLELVH